MSILASRLLTLRNSPILLKLPPYLSALCILVGIAWLLILPLDAYSRATYISENAILAGQVHTYFVGSEHNIFRAYRQEAYDLSQSSDEARTEGLERVLRENGLKVATQDYSWRVAGETIAGKNVYGIIQGPRADATEAMVLIAAWRNFEGEINYSGVAVALTLARYFKRWSIWSKDIIVLIPDDSVHAPEAWISAYHSTSSHTSSWRNISALPIKAGALQGAVAIDYPAGPWGQRFEKLDVLYDGINGALPNLDLVNTAVHIANTQMGVSCSLHGLEDHDDSYKDRLLTLGKGLASQGLGHATGPHSAFMPYHIDAITLKTVGDGWHDEMTLGRTTESVFRSINNLLEHFHQSFFFYLLLGANRFVSIGNYLPAAMIVAANFTITALGLWARSAKITEEDINAAPPKEKRSLEKLEVIREDDAVTVVPNADLKTVERSLLAPAATVLAVHLAGFLPLHLLNNSPRATLPNTLHTITTASLLGPYYLANILKRTLSPQQIILLQFFSLIVLAAALSTLATLNFSLALLIGLLASPLSFLSPLPRLASRSEMRTGDDAHGFFNAVAVRVPVVLAWAVCSPMVALYAVNGNTVRHLEGMLVLMARGGVVQGVWTWAVVWGVWWPAWVVGGVVLFSA